MLVLFVRLSEYVEIVLDIKRNGVEIGIHGQIATAYFDFSQNLPFYILNQ